MTINLTPEITKKVTKEICAHYGTKIIYTDNWAGRLYKKLVAIPLINKACKKANAGDPEKWLEDRVITVGKYIIMKDHIGNTSNIRKLFEQVKLVVHENTHKVQQDREGVLDFYIKYFREDSLRAKFELQAIQTEMYMTAWNDLPIGTVANYTRNLSKIYGFNKVTLKTIEQSITKMLELYHNHGIDILSSPIVEYSTKLLRKYS